jgi:apolipoprotein N-acyltransferase
LGDLGDFSASEDWTVFKIPGAAFGVNICFESLFPDLVRGFVERGAQLTVNISNDGWFKGTAEHEQHLALARFRAIECRRSVIRSVNMGISAVIDSNGRVLAPRAVGGDDECALWECSAQDRAELPVSRWSEFKSVAGVLTVAVPIDDRGSLYARWGDWFAWSCAAVAAVTFVLALRRQRRFLAD